MADVKQPNTNPPKTPLAAWCAARGLAAADISSLTGCSVRAAQRWLAGQRVPGPRFRARLCEVTGLEAYSNSPAGQGPTPDCPPRATYAREARAFEEALRALERSIGPFARGPAGARTFLRSAVDPSRVARVTNLAQLLFDEEAFADWLLLDSTLGGKRG